MMIKESKFPPEEQNMEKLYNSRLQSEAVQFKPGNQYMIKDRKMYPATLVDAKIKIPW
mgnify:CR=1 FL=1